MNREVEVFVDLDGTAHRVGRLWSRANKGRESASFEYDEDWVGMSVLKSSWRIARGIPPLIELPRLLAASERVVEDRDSDEDLRLLLAPGSSLRGARPKAAVVDTDGSLSIAKFPHGGDEYNVELWSGVVLSLAARAGVEVPAHRIDDVAGRQVLIVRRLDRVGGNRIPFLSAMSMLGASDGEDHSYLEIVDALRRHGADVNRDLPQLWRRILFGVLVSNLDDHLRNHGFLYGRARR